MLTVRVGVVYGVGMPLSENKTNAGRAGGLAWDFGRDHFIGEGIDWFAGKMGAGLEVEAGGKVLGKIASKGASAPAQAMIELGRGVWKIGREEGRKGDDTAGDKLVKEPLWYQAGNLLLNPAEALSQYGAKKERDDKVAFEKDVINGADGVAAQQMAKMLNEEVERKREEVEKERLASIDAAKRALDPDYDLEERTMRLVAGIVRPQSPVVTVR